MNYYGKYIKQTLDNIYDFEKILDRVQFDFNTLYDNILNNYYLIPTEEEYYFSFIKNMINKEILPFKHNILEGTLQRIGYNPIKIMNSVIGNPKLLLEKIVDYDLFKILRLKTDINQYYDSFQNQQQMSNILMDNNSILRNRYYCKPNSDYTKNIFPYVFKFNPQFEEESISSIIYIFIQSLFYKCCSYSTLDSSLLDYFNINNININDNFEIFMSNNRSDFIDLLYKSLINNNLLFYNEIDSFKTSNKIIIDSFLNQLSTIFIDQFKNYKLDSSLIGREITENFNNNIAKKCLETIYIDNIINFFDIELDTINTLEKTLYELHKKKFNDIYGSDLIQIQYMISQFKNNPLFYINAQLFSHNEWLKVILETNNYHSIDLLSESLLQNDYNYLDTIFNYIYITDEISLISLIKDIFISGQNEYLHCIKSILYDEFFILVEQFTQTDELNNLIIEELLKPLSLQINTTYFFQYNKYEYIEIIKLNIKLYLYKSIVNGNLFNNVVNNIYNETVTLLDTLQISEGDIQYQFNQLKLLKKEFYNNFERYFIAVTLSQYINKYLLNYSV
jgi:hypothetical protein